MLTTTIKAPTLYRTQQHVQAQHKSTGLTKLKMPILSTLLLLVSACLTSFVNAANQNTAAYPEAEKQIVGTADSIDVRSDTLQLWVIGPLVEMHIGPAHSYPIVHTLEKGEKVTLIKQFTNWLKMSSQDNTLGWVHRDDLVKLADTHGRPLTDRYTPPQKAGAFSVQFSLGSLDEALGGLGGIGYGLSEQLRLDLLLNHTTEGFLQGRTFLGQITLDFARQDLWQPYFNLGYGSFKSDGLISGQNSFDTFKAGVGVRRHLIGGLEGTFEYSKEFILISGPSNIHADGIRLGILTYF